MPKPRTVRDWMGKDETISAAIAQARDIGADAIAEECMRIADEQVPLMPSTGGHDSGFVTWQRMRIETRLKLLAKWNPKKYGEKLDVTSGDKPIPAPIIQVLPQSG